MKDIKRDELEVRGNDKIAKKGSKLDRKSEKDFINKLYRRKIFYYKGKIILGSLLMVIFAASIYFSDVKNNKLKSENIKREQIAKNYLNELEKKSADIKSKVNDAKKYKKVWEKADRNKKDSEGIKVDKINELIDVLSKEYNIKGSTIKISVPMILKNGVFSSTRFDVMNSDVSLDFLSLDDVSAIYFLTDFINNLPGYVDIDSLSITKKNLKGYSSQELVSISSGNLPNMIEVKFKFSWHILRKK